MVSIMANQFKKDGDDMYCYYWNDADDQSNDGWWVGIEVGGETVGAFGECKNPWHDMPPPIGWYTRASPNQQWCIDGRIQIIFGGDDDGHYDGNDEIGQEDVSVKRRKDEWNSRQSSVGSRLKRFCGRSQKYNACVWAKEIDLEYELRSMNSDLGEKPVMADENEDIP